VVLAVPMRSLRAVARGIAPHLKAGSLVVDVCSLKVGPLSILEAELPPHADILGTHPLFGPRSGRNGIEGLSIVLCSGRGRRGPAAARFLRKKWRLKVVETSPEQHDRQMAYVQGLTHLLARIVTSMNVPPLDHATETFSHLMRMVNMVQGDSDDLFRTILLDNPFTEDMTRSFLEATRRVLRGLESSTETEDIREAAHAGQVGFFAVAEPPLGSTH
jgi:prephenate dehydrogenase